MTETTPDKGAPWPGGFVENIYNALTDYERRHMTPEILHSIKAHLASVIHDYQARRELSEHIQVLGGDAGDGRWIMTIMDGIDRPSITITLDSRIEGSAADRLRDLRQRSAR